MPLKEPLKELSTPVPFPVLVLPFANFILDTTFTLFRRLIRLDWCFPWPRGSPAEAYGYGARNDRRTGTFLRTPAEPGQTCKPELPRTPANVLPSSPHIITLG